MSDTGSAQEHAKDAARRLAQLVDSAALAVVDGDQPHLCTVLTTPVDSPSGVALAYVFASKRASLHARLMTTPGARAGMAVWHRPADVGAFLGLQLRGAVRPAGPPARDAFLARFEFASPLLADPSSGLFELRVSEAKVTDNARLGLGRHVVAEWETAGVDEKNQ